MMNKQDKDIRLDGLSITILTISGIIILFSFFAPMIFVQSSNCGFNFLETGPIGDTIGGIMNPFIAISGVFLTFLAFYIQYKANRLQRDLFRQELDSNKFENQFYEMLRLHKENVNEIEITLTKQSKVGREIIQSEEHVKGRAVFQYLIREFELCYYITKVSHPENRLFLNIKKVACNLGKPWFNVSLGNHTKSTKHATSRRYLKCPRNKS